MSSGGELAFQSDVDKVARKLGWKRFAQANAPRGSTKGWPDRAYFRRGRVLVLEMKAEKDTKVSSEQRAWINEWESLVEAIDGLRTSVTRNPVRVAIVRPSDYDTVVKWLT